MHYSLDELIHRKEDMFFDRKSAKKDPKELLKHFIAFANASGGTLVIGMEDNGEITGFKHPKAHKPDDFLNCLLSVQKMPISFSHSLLPITNNKGEEDALLIFEIQPSIYQVIAANDGTAYLRSKDQSLTLSYEQRQQLEFDKGQRSFEDQVVADAVFEEDLDFELLQRYKSHLKTELGIREILKARNLLTTKNQLTNACVLLFGNNPTKFFPNARVRFLRYDGKAMQTGANFNAVKEFTFEEAIPKMIPKIRDAVNSQLREFQSLDDHGVFQRVAEYPEFAWFEGIVNALTHRNYHQQGDCIRISMYDDRLEIFSPGKLPNIVTLENMKETRYSRNPRIARVLLEFGWVKELNEGVKRIFNEMEQFLLKAPTYEEPNGTALKLVLENNIIQRTLREIDQVTNLLTENVMNSLSDNERIIVHYMYLNERITVKIAAEVLKRSNPVSRRVLKELQEKNILIWHGLHQKDPTQYFTLNVPSKDTSPNLPSAW